MCDGVVTTTVCNLTTVATRCHSVSVSGTTHYISEQLIVVIAAYEVA